MADIQFDEEQQYQPSYQTEQKPLFVRLVLATRIVSTDRQAEYFLLSIAGVCVLITLFMLFSGANRSHPSPAQLEQAQQYLKTYPK